jgi:hypothetical protein
MIRQLHQDSDNLSAFQVAIDVVIRLIPHGRRKAFVP